MISLTGIPCKLLKHVVVSTIMGCVEEHSSLSVQCNKDTRSSDWSSLAFTGADPVSPRTLLGFMDKVQHTCVWPMLEYASTVSVYGTHSQPTASKHWKKFRDRLQDGWNRTTENQLVWTPYKDSCSGRQWWKQAHLNTLYKIHYGLLHINPPKDNHPTCPWPHLWYYNLLQAEDVLSWDHSRV